MTEFNRSFPYGAGRTERVIEIPWALSKYDGGRRVLEVGCSFASENPEYIQGLKALNIPELHGIDISSVEAPNFIKKTADIRKSGYPSNFFDMVLCISTIEHVGRDNTRYYQPVAEIASDDESDRAALCEMLRITCPQGLIVVTAPYGKFQNHGWFVNYDAADISRLFRGVERADEYFQYTHEGWIPCSSPELEETDYGDNGAPGAAGLACFKIRKSAELTLTKRPGA